MLEHCDADAAVNGLIAVHHQEPIDHRLLVVTYNLAAGGLGATYAGGAPDVASEDRFLGPLALIECLHYQPVTDGTILELPQETPGKEISQGAARRRRRDCSRYQGGPAAI